MHKMDENNRKQLTLEDYMKLMKIKLFYSQDPDEFKKQRHDLIHKNTPTKKKIINGSDYKKNKLAIQRKLLNGLEKFPGLYDKSHPDFSINKERRNYWIQLTEYLNLEKSTDIIKSQIKNLIKRYKKERENPNSTWELLNDARFLDIKFKDEPMEIPEDDDEDSVNNAVSSSNIHIILDSSDEEEDEIQNNDINYSGNEEAWPSCSPPQNEPQILSEHCDISTQQEIINPENDILREADEIKQEMEINLNYSYPNDTNSQVEDLNQPQNDEKGDEQIGSSLKELNTTEMYKSSLMQNVNDIHYEVNEAFGNYIIKELNNLPPLVASKLRKRTMKIFCEDY